MENKIRAKLVKGSQVRFISHLDLMNTMIRALRRAEIPMAYSQGYNPRPQLSFASALAVGLTSDGEYIDLELEDVIEGEEFKRRVNDSLPEGLEISRAELVPFKTKSLMAQVNRASYFVRLKISKEVDYDLLKESFEEFLANDEVLVRRKRRRKKDRIINIIQMIEKLEVLGVQGELATLSMLIHSGSSGNLRPEEVVRGLEDSFDFIKGAKSIDIHRAGLYVKDGEELFDPIEVVKNS
ncbi:TIGR03936 family radical SAM-associated protein [Halonatronum saccharophilum]|uniref:TIGR03936 family radical SAM-associated protein n=1 Tax=Halonatronum saccharophilum TaxID=150060 RepID=UPI000484CC7E|nr:TIGR03936 family radical SAM-associated protein [Halonatronum saccharophilum]